MLTWTTETAGNRTIHSTYASDTSEKGVRNIIEAAVDKAISLLNINIQDNSLYLLFEWDSNQAKLTIFVTDASKTQDASESVCCVLPSLAIELARESEEQRLDYTESVKFWLHDYLPLCTAFFSYSLVAIFHSSTRSNTELL